MIDEVSDNDSGNIIMTGENVSGDSILEENDYIVFAPEGLTLLIRKYHKLENLSAIRQISVRINNSTSAMLVIYDPGSPSVDDHYILDIQARIIAEEAKDPETNEVLSCVFKYSRLEVVAIWQVYPSAVCGFEELATLDFIFGQYVYYDNLKNLAEAEKLIDLHTPKYHRERDTNMIAKGFEGTGSLVRQALRGTGQVTGESIRQLGRLYTEASVKSRQYFGKPVAALKIQDGLGDLSGKVSSDENNQKEEIEAPDSVGVTELQKKVVNCDKVISQISVDRAIKHKERAAAVHASARVLTGAALYPVRWTGKKASEWASPGNSNIDIDSKSPQSSSGVSKVVTDTFGGMFNAVVSSFKGVTEAIGEIGSAINETAINHATTIHGEEYAQHVTRHYLDAAGHVGLAGYKVLNVAAFGLAGIAADAAVEGATFLTSLSEFLVGPIILQGFMDVVQYPLLTPTRYFAILRPWSLAFYCKPSDIHTRPQKIIISAMLDTIPILRNHHLVSEPLSPQAQNDIIKKASSEKNESLKDGSKAQEKSPGFFNRLRGGDRPHIEICTVDCSTYLIYPNYLDSSEASITDWYDELKKACRRVETVAKHKSGAEDITLERRLRLLPKNVVLVFTLKCCILDSIGDGISVEGQEISDFGEGSEPLDYELDVKNLPEGDIESASQIAEFCPSAVAESIDEINIDEPVRSEPVSEHQNLIQATSTIKEVTSSEKVSVLGKTVSTLHGISVNAVRVRLVPLSEKGIYLRDEMCLSDSCRTLKYSKPNNLTALKYEEFGASPPSKEYTTERYIRTLYDEVGRSRLDRDGNKVGCWEDQTFYIGHEHCLTSGDIKYISITLHGKTLVGAYIEIGRGRLLIADVLKLANENKNFSKWIPMMHTATNQKMAYLLVDARFEDINTSEFASKSSRVR